MKKIFLTLMAISTLWSCQTDEEYENLNKDPKNPTDVDAAFLFNSASVSLARQLADPDVNSNIFRFFAQYLTATTYTDEPNFNFAARNIPENYWSEIYRDVLLDLQDARNRTIEDTDLSEEDRASMLAQIEVIEVYTWQVMVDTFGDIPYTDALNAQETPSPAYDDAATIYEDLIARIQQASSSIRNGQGFSTADPIYDGDMDGWYRFANSLQLRLGMRLSDVNPSLAQQTVENAISKGLITANDQNATLQFLSNPPNTNPLWEALVQSGRSDYVAANTLVNIMNPINDPRRQFYFDSNLDGDYVGGIYGASNTYSLYTHIGSLFREPDREGLLLDYAEVQFQLTGAAKAGFATPMPIEEHYTQAITASIEYWGGSDAQVANYLSQSRITYNGSDEQLATQFWIAMFDNPLQGWSVWRKYDAPQLNLPFDSQRPVPLRYTYPISEQNLNEANYDAASENIGGDDQQTAIFWDVQ